MRGENVATASKSLIMIASATATAPMQITLNVALWTAAMPIMYICSVIISGMSIPSAYVYQQANCHECQGAERELGLRGK
jgi:hypothetical protein